MIWVRLAGGVRSRLAPLLGDGLTRSGVATACSSLARAPFAPPGDGARLSAFFPGLALGLRLPELDRALL